mmetsp:Transcript_34796/g.90534  ORF Transcript_34796/g.90534 Transcript_34796/m.90534 type:complete len:249 (+) Transcript_34796:3-749(+)
MMGILWGPSEHPSTPQVACARRGPPLLLPVTGQEHGGEQADGPQGEESPHGPRRTAADTSAPERAPSSPSSSSSKGPAAGAAAAVAGAAVVGGAARRGRAGEVVGEAAWTGRLRRHDQVGEPVLHSSDQPLCLRQAPVHRAEALAELRRLGICLSASGRPSRNAVGHDGVPTVPHPQKQCRPKRELDDATRARAGNLVHVERGGANAAHDHAEEKRRDRQQAAQLPPRPEGQRMGSPSAGAASWEPGR